MAKHSIAISASEWMDVEPDFRPSQLSRLGLDCGSLIHLIGNWLSGIRLYVTHECLESVCMHVGSSSQEVGGLLIGRVFEVQKASDPVVVIEQSLESLDFQNSAVRLEMKTELWDRAHAAFEEDRCVVGWYHSHPNLGAFFSSTDRNTQRAFFSQPYSVGWVLDPDRVEQKVFVAQDSIEYSVPLIVLDHEPEMTGPLAERRDCVSTNESTVEVKMIPTARSGGEPVIVTVAGLNSIGGNGK